MYDVYDFDSGKPLPENCRLVRRYLSGKFLLVVKSSPYNGLPQTYSGNHSLLSANAFSDYMSRLKMGYDILQLKGFNDHHKELALNEIAKELDKEYASEENHAIQHEFEQENLLREKVKQSFLNWEFQLTEQQEQSVSAKFFFEFQQTNSVSSHNDFSEHYCLCTDKHFVKNPESCSIFYLYRREEAIKFREELLRQIRQMTDTTQVNLENIGVDITIKVKKTGKPSHLFTKEEIKNLMKEADDRKGNTLVIDENGYGKFIAVFNRAIAIKLKTYPVLLNFREPRSNFVGKYSNLSSLQEIYILSLHGWKKYLETGDSQSVFDFVSLQTEDELVTEIKLLY